MHLSLLYFLFWLFPSQFIFYHNSISILVILRTWRWSDSSESSAQREILGSPAVPSRKYLSQLGANYRITRKDEYGDDGSSINKLECESKWVA